MSAAKSAVLASLQALVDEALDRKNLVEGQAWADNEFYHARVTLIHALASVYVLWCERHSLESPTREKAETLLPLHFGPRSLWGEGAIPQLLAHYWYLSWKTSGLGTEAQLAALAAHLIESQLDDQNALSSPYYSVEDVVVHGYFSLLPTAKEDPIDRDSFVGSSWMALPLFQLVVRANLKQLCKQMWPDLTRLGHSSFDVAEAWQYGVISSKRGRVRHDHTRETGAWADVQNEARDCAMPKVPDPLRADPIMLLLFAIVAPHRATPDVIRFLGRSFSDVWFL